MIGTGGFATVYHAEYRGVDVACKFYNESLTMEPEVRRDMERESELCFKLRMPYIVTFYGKSANPAKMGIVMEFLPFGSLGALLKANPHLEMPFKIHVGLDISRAVNFLHKNKIIHRDM